MKGTRKTQFKAIFKKNIDFIIGLKATNLPRKVFIVPLQWHIDFISWINNTGAKMPQQPNTKTLLTANKVKPNLKRGVDYEILDLKIWNDTSRVFETNQKIDGILIKNPKSDEEVVLFNSVEFNIFLTSKRSTFQYFSDSSWILSDVKQQICKAHKIEPNDFIFAKHSSTNPNDSIKNEQIQMKDVFRRYSKDLDLKKSINKLPPINGNRNKLNNENKKKTRQPSVPRFPKPFEKKNNETKSHLDVTEHQQFSSASQFSSIGTKRTSQQHTKSRPGSENLPKSAASINETKNNNDSLNHERNSGEISTPTSNSPTTTIKTITTISNTATNSISNTATNNISNTKNNDISKIKNDVLNTTNNDILNTKQSSISNTTQNSISNTKDTNKSNNINSFSNPLSGRKSLNNSINNLYSTNEPSYSNSNSKIPKPVGLNNLGNTCFFNAAVQCLTRVMPLTNFILSSSFESQLNPNNPKSSKGRIANAYRSFLQDMSKGSSYGSRDPSDLRRAIVTKFKRFANFGQHDSQELLYSILDGLHEDMNQSSFAHGREPAKEIKSTDDSWSLHKSRNSSPIVDIFHGVLYSSISCPECKNVEAVHDPFMFLSLDMPRRFSTVKLADCLNSFSQRETLDAANKWKCEKCGKMVCATKEMGVEKCAKVVIIHLKRFSGEGYFSSKIDTNVDYPDFLESSSFAKHDSGRFKLIGAVFHSGGLGGGHYTSAAIDPNSGDWYSFNDSMATKIDSKSAHKGSAYILFYQRE